ncbi:unnamed protein product, partial [Porites evermanni]
LSFTKPFSQVSFRQNHPLVHQLQHEDSQSDVLQPEEDIDENIQESPIRHASHNRTNGDASNPCFHFTERTWDSCRQKYVYKAHCHGSHVASLVDLLYRHHTKGASHTQWPKVPWVNSPVLHQLSNCWFSVSCHSK